MSIVLEKEKVYQNYSILSLTLHETDLSLFKGGAKGLTEFLERGLSAYVRSELQSRSPDFRGDVKIRFVIYADFKTDRLTDDIVEILEKEIKRLRK